MLGAGSLMYSQVGVGAKVPAGSVLDSTAYTHPQGALHLQGMFYENETTTRNLGLVLPITDSAETIKTPAGENAVRGTMVYEYKDPNSDGTIDSGCLRVKLADRWQDCLVDNSSISNVFDFDIYGGINVPVKKVSAGYNYSLIIGLNDNSVYATGYNGEGRAGSGIGGDLQSFTMVLARRVVDVSAGYNHSLAATSEGELWAWGNGANSKHGLGTVTDYYYPTKVNSWPSDVKAVRVEAGYLNSLVLGDDQRVYAMGYNYYGLTGIGGAVAGNTSIPTQIPSLSTIDVKDISLSQNSAAALTTDGKIYVWGQNSAYGRLGTGSNGVNYITPTEITLPNNDTASYVVMGNEHGLAISADGKRLYAWGQQNGFGMGADLASYYSTPTDITAQIPDFDAATDTITSAAVSRIYSALNASIVITSKGMYAAGANSNPQKMGLGFFDFSTEVKYSPVYAGINATSGFKPLYTQAVYAGTVFNQASMGWNHSLFTSTAAADGSGGLGYGTGEYSYYALFGSGSRYLAPAFPVLLKQ